MGTPHLPAIPAQIVPGSHPRGAHPRLEAHSLGHGAGLRPQVLDNVLRTAGRHRPAGRNEGVVVLALRGNRAMRFCAANRGAGSVCYKFPRFTRGITSTGAGAFLVVKNLGGPTEAGLL